MKDSVTPAQAPALALIQQALAADVSPEKLHALLAVKKDWEADEARKAYYRALCDFQAEAPIIEKGEDANGKAYARMDRIWRTIRPIITKVGLSVTWQVSELRDIQPVGLVCHLEGTLAHRDGHIVKLTSDMPVPDAIVSSSGKAVQNKSQVMGSAQTYGERYATCKALGLVTGEDDDGNGGVLTTIDAEEQKAIKDSLDAWRGVANWTQEREEVFWRFVNVPKLASGNHDLSKLPMSRLADVLDLLKRSFAGAKK